MRYTVKIKNEVEPLKFEADDVELDSQEVCTIGEVTKYAVDYNFFIDNNDKNGPSVARIPYDNVIYIARL